MIKNYATIQAEPIERPQYLVPVEDYFHSRITRITADTGTAMPVVGGAYASDSRHHYSKDQPFSDDGKLLKLQQKGGDPSNFIVDAETYQPLFSDRQSSPEGVMLRKSHETRWRPGYPTQMVSTIKLPAGLTVAIWDVLTGLVEWQGVIPTGDPAFGWAGEGQISDDGRWTCFSTRLPEPQANTNEDYLIIVDLLLGRIGPRCPLRYATTAFPTSTKGLIGNCGISPTGRFAEVKLSGAEQYGFILDIDQDSLMATPHQMAVDGLRMGPTEARGGTGASLGAIAWMSHPDFNIDTQGFEVVVGGGRGFDQSNTDPVAGKKYGNVIAVDCLTGRHRHVSPGEEQLGGLRAASMQHGSGRAYKRRGWHLISTEMGNMSQWGAGEIQWVLLDSERKIERLCIHRSMETGIYRAEAHPVASPDGSKVLFASNWGGVPDLNDVKAYIATAANGAPPPPADLPKYYVDKAWTYSPDGAILDRTTGRLVPLEELAQWGNERPR